MLIIACLSQKGGVGKSTLSRLISVAYASADWRVKIADFNVKQKTSTDWAAIRMSAKVKPEIQAEAFTQVKAALRQRDQFDLMIMDGRPDSDVSTLELAREANMIIVPVGVSVDDLQPQVRFANELRSKGIDKRQIFFAINKSVESLVAVEDAREFIRSAGYTVFETDIPIKTGYQMAQNTGRAILETTFPTLNDRATALAAEIVTALATLVNEPAA